MGLFLGLLVLASAAAQIRAAAIFNCSKDLGNEFIADEVDLCVYYQCRNGAQVGKWPDRCAKGTRMPSYFNRSLENPCTVSVKKSKCLRCDINDIPPVVVSETSYCSKLQPCDAGCACHDEFDGYWCDCSVQVVTLPSVVTAVPQCKDPGYCKNGGTCYKLYDEDPFCNCIPGWTGKQCDSKLCDWNPCLNNGTCVVNGSQIHCNCDYCWKGSCCETRRVEDPDCIGCSACAGGLNCTGIRTWLCECNPCPSADYICSRAPLNKVRDCNQGAATAGSRFTLMFEQNFFSGGDALSALEVYVTAGGPDGRVRNVTVSAPRGVGACSLRQKYSIPPGAIQKVNIPIGCRHDGTGVQNFGILVQEDQNDTVTVYGINRASNSADSFLALPDRRAGTNFVVIAYPSFRNQNGTDHETQLGIVATEPNTQVNITLSTASNIPGSVSDHTYVITLQDFQTYQIQASKFGADLSGTIIVSSKPIHVVSGNMRTSVLINRPPAGTLSTDHLVEEMPPADTWGATFAIVPIPRTSLGYTKTEELIRLVASFDTTCLLYSSAPTRTIIISTLTDWYREFTIDASDNYFLDCNQPVLIMEITESADERLSQHFNDPAMIYIPAVDQYTNYYTFAQPVYSQTNGPYNTTLAILAAKPSDYLLIEVNNVPTANLPQFKPWSAINVPTAPNYGPRPALLGGIFNIPNNAPSTIRHPVKQVGFMCLIYAYDDRESIGHVAGSALSSSNDLENGFGLSQWSWVRGLNVTFL